MHRGLLDLINAKIPTEVILFEVAKEKDTRRVTERIAEIMYAVVLRELGYAEELGYCRSGNRTRSRGAAAGLHGTLSGPPQAGLDDRPGGCSAGRTRSAILHHLRPGDIPLGGLMGALPREPTITVSKVVERTFDLPADAAPARRWCSSSTRWVSRGP